MRFDDSTDWRNCWSCSSWEPVRRRSTERRPFASIWRPVEGEKVSIRKCSSCETTDGGLFLVGG